MITKNEYLKMAGYDPKIWEIIGPKTSLLYKKEKGHDLNMYVIVDRKPVEAFGKGSYVCKSKWVMDTIDIMDAEGRSGSDKQAPLPPQTEDSVVPPVPPTPSSVLQPPPLTVPQPPASTTKKVEEAVVKEEWICDKYNQTGVICDSQCDFCKGAQANGVTLEEQKQIAEAKLQKIVDDSGVPKENVIIATVPKIDKTATVIEEGLDHKGTIEKSKENEQVRHPRVDELIKAGMKLCLDEDKDYLSNGGLKIVIKDLIKLSDADFKRTLDFELAKPKSGAMTTKGKVPEHPPVMIPSDEDIANMNEADARDAIMLKQKGTIKGKGVGTLTAKATPEVKEKVKVKPKKEDKPKVNELKDVTLPVASDKTVKHFAVIDEVIGTLSAFKWTYYAVESIREILNSDTTHARKITSIKKLLENV